MARISVNGRIYDTVTKKYIDDEPVAATYPQSTNQYGLSNEQAIGLGIPAAGFGTGGIFQTSDLDINALNRMISEQNTANFNRDYSPGGSNYREPTASTPDGIDEDSLLANGYEMVKNAATGVWEWVKKNAVPLAIGGAATIASGNPLVGSTTFKAADKIFGSDDTETNIYTPTGGVLATPDQMNTWMNTPNYTDFTMGDTGTASGNVFDVTPAPTIDYNSLNTSGGILGGVPFNVNQSNNIANPAPNSNINIGETGTPSGQVFDPVINADYGLDTSKMDFMNGTSTITPSYGDNFKNAGLDTNIVNLNDKVNAGPQVTAETGLTTKSTKTTPDLSLKKTTSTPAQIDSNIIANAIRNSPLNQNQYAPDAQISNATNNLPPPSNTVTPTGGTDKNTTTFSPTKTYDELTMTPYNISSGLPEGYKTADIGVTGGALPTITPDAIPDYNLRTTPFTDMGTLTTNANVSPGDLPQFRKQLNRALVDANNAAIMTGRPISRSTISGAVEGLASGASDRMNAANQLALENRRIESSELQQARGLRSQEQQQAEKLGLSKWETQSQLAQNLAIQQAQLQESQRQFNSEMAENQRQFDNGEINKFEYQKREQELQKWKAENEFALDNQKLQLLQDQAATAKDQWERGFITEKEYNDRILDLQEKYAELGYKADADFLKKSEKNQDWGNIIGTLSLLDDLWG